MYDESNLNDVSTEVLLVCTVVVVVCWFGNPRSVIFTKNNNLISLKRYES